MIGFYIGTFWDFLNFILGTFKSNQNSTIVDYKKMYYVNQYIINLVY